MAMRHGLSANPVEESVHGFEKRGQAITRVTITRLELDNIYREEKGMLHMTLCNGSSYDFKHIWELARSARNHYRLSNRM